MVEMLNHRATQETEEGQGIVAAALLADACPAGSKHYIKYLGGPFVNCNT